MVGVTDQMEMADPLVGVERSSRIFVAGISRNSNRLMAPGCSTTG